MTDPDFGHQLEMKEVSTMAEKKCTMTVHRQLADFERQPAPGSGEDNAVYDYVVERVTNSVSPRVGQTLTVEGIQSYIDQDHWTVNFK